MRRSGCTVKDCGPFDTQSVDYPDFAGKVGRAVAQGEADRGVLICGSGIGMSIAANKIGGIRAAVVQDAEHARLAAEHNGANVLCIGGRFTAPQLAQDIVTIWMNHDCTEARHHRRINKIGELETS